MQGVHWKWWVLGLLLVAATVASVLQWSEKGPRHESDQIKEGATELSAKRPRQTQSTGQPIANQPAATLLLEKTWAQLASCPPAQRAALLRRTARRLTSLSIGEAQDAILAELESGRDAETGLNFAVGEAGLDSAPTWRVYLLDMLGRINPRIAAEHAREAVFPATASPDEWAVSMRNVLQSYPPRSLAEGRTETAKLLARMMARPEWRAAPSAGMLEAMDFVAHTIDPARHLSELTRWLDEPSNPPVEQAVQIAVERAVVLRGDEVLPALAQAAGTAGDGGAAVRAMAMARADLRRPSQREALADYLRRLPPASAETAAFFGAFPLHTFSVAPGLTGLPRVPEGRDLRAADEAALAVIRQWSTDPALTAHRPRLIELSEKLREWTENR